MKSLVIVSLNGISSRVHRRAVVAMATLSLVAVGCAQGSIGDRCNPDLAAGEARPPECVVKDKVT